MNCCIFVEIFSSVHVQAVEQQTTKQLVAPPEKTHKTSPATNAPVRVRPIREFPIDLLNPPKQEPKIDICFGCVQQPGDYTCYFSVRSPTSVSNITLKAMERHRINGVNPTDTHVCASRAWVAGEGPIIDGRCPLQYPARFFQCK